MAAENLNEQNQSEEMKRAIKKKEQYRHGLAQRIGLQKIGYTYKMLKEVYRHKASYLSADAFSLKVQNIIKSQEDSTKTAEGGGGQKRPDSSHTDASSTAQLKKKSYGVNREDQKNMQYSD